MTRTAENGGSRAGITEQPRAPLGARARFSYCVDRLLEPRNGLQALDRARQLYQLVEADGAGVSELVLELLDDAA